LAINLDGLLIHVILNTIIIGPILWLAGRAVEGKYRARFVDGLWIAALGTLIGDVLGSLFTGVIAEIIVVIIWLALIKHFFHCGWLKAILTAIVAVIISIVILFILGLVGLAAYGGLLPHF
jgi:hypothetical protein